MDTSNENKEKNSDAEEIVDVSESEPEDDFVLEKDPENTQREGRENKDIVADLRAKLKTATDEKAEYLLGWQKAKADYINSRKQDEESNKQFVKYAETGLVSDLIPILDSFDMALANKEAWAKLPPEWQKGIEQIKNQILSVLADHKLEIIDPLGKPFDTREAEAVGVVPTSKSDDDEKVMSVFQKGYKIHDRVIRPAKVQVGRFTETSS